MATLKTVLVVDDNEINRRILSKALSEDYRIITADNGRIALHLLESCGTSVCAVMLDLVMPVMDGYAFLSEISRCEQYKNLPVIVSTDNDDQNNELHALELGAWDFVSKPYNREIIRFRLKNAIERSQLTALRQLKYLAEFDALTGLYNKTQFFLETERLLKDYPEKQFVFLRFDIARFSLVNFYYGTAEGDRLLQYIAQQLQLLAAQLDHCCFGRIEADEFAFCFEQQDRAQVESIIRRAKKSLSEFDIDFDILPTFGIYEIHDHEMPVSKMLDCANWAAKQIKGSYVRSFAYYSNDITEKLNAEQEILNEMACALEQRQFIVHLQPKYDIRTNKPAGAEALVRWQHPVKGIIPPSIFIPVFERNGFIAKLDYYVWETVCRLIRCWIDRGLSPYPISVNVSRVNLYSSTLVDTLCQLTARYDVPHQLLNLELTESAYTDNPDAMKETMRRLHEKEFIVLMDDFGSGYSSLNLLKDIDIDVLKIDMGFFSKSDKPGRGENIVASVVRMAKWLNIPTVAEGVELSEQVEFLNSIGCEYVQGYYFAKPMPVEAYEALMQKNGAFLPEVRTDSDMDALWQENPQMDLLFSSLDQPMCFCEYRNAHTEFLRANRAFYNTFGYPVISEGKTSVAAVVEEHRATIQTTFDTVAKTHTPASCQFQWSWRSGPLRWIQLNVKYVQSAAQGCILLCSLVDITAAKEIDLELKKYRSALRLSDITTNKLLIVDDQEVNRAVLQEIFEDNYIVLHAENGNQAISVLAEHNHDVDVILLDLIMPEMDGMAFLTYKKTHPEISEIPVVIITALDSPEQQVNTLALGANDYIVKPFVPEVVLRRVTNVLESQKRFRQMVQEYNNAIRLAHQDPLTGIYNRIAAQDAIEKALTQPTDTIHAMVMLDLDNFKEINDTHGHVYGDEMLIAVAEKLKSFFRKDDIAARFGGDEFAVFMTNIPSPELALGKCSQLCYELRSMRVGSNALPVSVSIGIAVSSQDSNTFDTLYKNADLALYEAKRGGRSRVSLFGVTKENALPTQWVSKEWLCDIVNDAVFLFDCATHELLFASPAALQMCELTSCHGEKCFALLHGLSAPCADCIQDRLGYGDYCQRYVTGARPGRDLILRSKLVDFNSRKAHLVLALDLSRTMAAIRKNRDD